MIKQSEHFKELIQWIEKNKTLGVERFEFESPVKTVTQAVEISGFEKSLFIKTICMKHRSEDLFIIAILKAGSKVDKKVLRENTAPKRWNMATSDEILEIIGFPVGGLPPVCLPKNQIIYVDPRVLKQEFVIGGGGTENSLMRLPSQLILKGGAIEKIISFG